jgi:hypothetical protein
VDTSKAYATFRAVCQDINALGLYFIYGVESQFIHPSLLTINAYCDPSADPSRAALTTSPLPSDHHRHSFYLIAMCLIWSGRDLERLIPDSVHAAGLETLAVQIEAARTLPPYQPPPAPMGRTGKQRPAAG